MKLTKTIARSLKLFCSLLSCLAFMTAGAETLKFDFSAILQPLSPNFALPLLGGGNGLSLVLERNTIRPGERWSEAYLEIKENLPPDAVELRAFIYDSQKDGHLVAEKMVIPSGLSARLSVDLRTLGLSAARLRVELAVNKVLQDAVETFLYAAPPQKILTPGERVKILLSPATTNLDALQPVTFGFPLPPGSLWAPQALRLVDNCGQEIPFQFETTALWAPDGSIKWGRFDSVVNVSSGCWVEVNQAEGLLPDQPVETKKTARGIKITIGQTLYELACEKSPIAAIWQDGKCIVDGTGGRGLFVVDQSGREGYLTAADLLIESAGPVVACVKLEGDYKTLDGTRLAHCIVRLEFFAGLPEVKVTHSLILTEDSNKVWFKEIGWELKVSNEAPAQALFGTKRETPEEKIVFDLKPGTSAYALQHDHAGIAGTTNAYVMGFEDGASQAKSGEEMGDWAAFIGEKAGLVWVCKDVAWQHPKEFKVVSDGTFSLLLFSSRSGKELDFRAPTLVKKWRLAEKLSEEDLEKMNQHASNAAGWAKTHTLWLVPLAGKNLSAEKAAGYGKVSQHELFALADPVWIYAGGAMGPIYPRDRERFPIEERMIETYMKRYSERVPGEHYYGFIDYYAGPHYGHAGRYRLIYTLLHDAWLVYARSGDRYVRDFAQGANRVYMDNYFSHWDTPKKQKGLLTRTEASDIDRTLKSNYPFYWEEYSTLDYSTSVNLNQFAWDYYLTGNRRSYDIILEYAEALKKAWQPDTPAWRVIQTARMLLLSYSFTWDTALRSLFEATVAGRIYDSVGEIALTKNRAYKSTTYKMPTDVDILIEAWELLGAANCFEIALKTSEFIWNSTGIDGRSSGLGANFLYKQTKHPAIAAGIDYYRRLANTAYNEEAATVRPVAYSQLARTFQGLPYSLDIIAQTDADRQSLVAWIDIDLYGSPLTVYIRKNNEEAVNLLVRLTGRARGHAGERLKIEPAGSLATSIWGLDLNQVHDTSGGFTKIRLPKDAPPGDYCISADYKTRFFMSADSRLSLVFYAPDFWVPNTLKPAVNIYFEVPVDAENPAVFFENTALLYKPDGSLFSEEPLTGWVELPDQPGIWSFLPVNNGLVRVAGLPPFFAMGDPAYFFIPDVDFTIPSRPKRHVSEESRKGGDFVAGVSGGSADFALYLDDKVSFEVPAGDEGCFIPHQEGTIEFYFKPDWGTFDLKRGTQPVLKDLVTVFSDEDSWRYVYRLDPEGTTVILGPTEPSHSLFGRFNTTVPGRAAPGPEMRAWLLRSLFEAGKWVHLAWVWGPTVSYDAHNRKVEVPVLRLFLNGKSGERVFHSNHAGAVPAGVPRKIVLPRLQGAVDQLRVSDVQRYRGEFEVPGRTGLECDEHTRVFFDFDGSLEGRSGQRVGEVVVGVVE